uniref:Uncharacterized protein n=1 Tax=Haptolina brevifila TaxID=156173 RepID=A0A7S2D4K0_9EUKA|mmetsp:Transcript_33066/g.65764  ORF Transcript_33066/g.65764 Transcript_33066/m.65764 type:complete len:105 (+) Transcript_33066:326-640(+)
MGSADLLDGSPSSHLKWKPVSSRAEESYRYEKVETKAHAILDPLLRLWAMPIIWKHRSYTLQQFVCMIGECRGIRMITCTDAEEAAAWLAPGLGLPPTAQIAWS